MQKNFKHNVMITVQIENAITLHWNKSLGVNLSNLRKEKRLTRQGLVDLTGISKGLLEKLETGLVPTITKDNLILLVATLGVPIKDIYPILEIEITEIA